MPELIVNEADLIRARESLLSGFLGALDAKRPSAWTVYGYPQEVTFQMLLSAYQRSGPAYGAVHRILDKCWQIMPRIKQPDADESTKWEDDIGKLFKDICAWQKLIELDRRNMIGRFSALIYRVADGQKLSQPLVRAQRLVDLVPLYEDQIKVTQWNSDQDSEDFGKPLMFQYRMQSPSALTGDIQGQPDQWVDVHPSRVQILAEGSVGNMFDGVPMLRAGFNALVDLEKITGGSAESYLKNSARVLAFEYDAQSSIQTAVGATSAEEVKAKHEERVKALNRNQDAAVVTQGGKVAALQTQTHDPRGAFDVAAFSFSASVRRPYTIIFGQQTGRLASDEDRADEVASCASRQANLLTPMITELVTRLQAAGLVKPSEFEIEWQDLAEPSETQKLERADKMAGVNQKQSAAGRAAPFRENEIRKAAGYEEDDELVGLPLEGDPGELDQETGDPLQPTGAKAPEQKAKA